MTYDEFIALSEDEQRAAYIESGAYDDLEAERNSLRDENTQLRAQMKEISDSARKVKEMNYSLVRRLDTGAKKQDACDILNEMFN